MTFLIKRTGINILFLTLFLTAFFTSNAQEIQRDNSPVVKDKNYWFMEGMREYNNKNFAPAQQAFLKVVETEPNNGAAYYYLSNIALANKDITSAELFISKAVENDSTNYWYSTLLAKIYAATKKLNDAAEIYEKITALHPKKIDIYYDLANIYLSQKNTEKAHQTIDKIEQVSGKSENTSITKFNLYRMSNDLETAISVLEEDSQKIASPRIETILGDMYSDLRKDSLSMLHYNNALKMIPDYVPAIYGQAELYRRNNNNAGFLSKVAPVVSNPQVEAGWKTEYLEQLIKLPGFVQKCKPQMDILMESLANTHPCDTLVNELATAYFVQTGNKEKCRELLNNFVSNNPQDNNAKLRYLSYLYYEKQWEELETEAEKELAKTPESLESLELLGIAQYNMEKYSDAITTFSKINELARRSKDTTAQVRTYSTIGDLYHTIGDKKMAYANYKKALKIDPNYNPVLNNYAYYLALENKNLKQACKMSRKTIETEPDNATYLDTYAWILHLLGKNEEAKAHLKHAMLYGGTEDKDILLHYAEILEALGDKELAKIYKEKAAKIEE